jgi:hypothetical protein
MNIVQPDFSAIKRRARLCDLYLHLRWVLLPLCWPEERGRCGCGRNHEGKAIGKAPLVSLIAAETGAISAQDLFPPPLGQLREQCWSPAPAKRRSRS